jgi:general secretion pathway protein D
LASLQSGQAETLTTAQDYAVDSDVVLESAVREVKSIPRDTVNVVGDAVKMVSDETVTAVNGVKSVFKADPIVKTENAAALEVANAWNTANDVIFRSYKVSESVGKELAEGREVCPETGAMDVSGYFNGIEFPKGASAMYRPEFKRLFVRQTLANMLSVEDVLASEHNAKRTLMGKQVEIQTKFVEVNQSTLNELGFNWTLTDATTGLAGDYSIKGPQSIGGAGLRTAAGAVGAGAASDTLQIVKAGGGLNWNMVISALEQSDNADTLSAPSITTRDGKAASIWVGEQRMVPKSFAAKAQNTSVFVENSDWKSELMGVQLEVTPELRKGGLIDLDLKPKVIDLIGYDDYEVTPNNADIQAYAIGNSAFVRRGLLANSFIPSAAYLLANTGLNATTNALATGGKSIPSPNIGETPVPSLHGQLPYFRIREMTTKVTVADGSTVGMGGLIYDKMETYKDKVPVLGSIPLIGRLFRSEGEKTIKRNLMIFVTATEVDVNGRRAVDMVMKK